MLIMLQKIEWSKRVAHYLGLTDFAEAGCAGSMIKASRIRLFIELSRLLSIRTAGDDRHAIGLKMSGAEHATSARVNWSAPPYSRRATNLWNFQTRLLPTILWRHEVGMACPAALEYQRQDQGIDDFITPDRQATIVRPSGVDLPQARHSLRLEGKNRRLP